MGDVTHASETSSAVAAGRLPPWRRVHVVGIGGAGMSGIARIMAAQ